MFEFIGGLCLMALVCGPIIYLWARAIGRHYEPKRPNPDALEATANAIEAAPRMPHPNWRTKEPRTVHCPEEVAVNAAKSLRACASYLRAK